MNRRRRIQSSTFARPASTRPLFPSLAASEMSITESTGEPPSLVSDSSSTFSVSPRLAISPRLELCPLSGYGRSNARRPTLPTLHFPPPSPFCISEHDSQAYYLTSRNYGETKIQCASYCSLHFLVATDSQNVSFLSQESQSSIRTYSTSAVPAPVQLPHLQLVSRLVYSEPAAARDSRMYISFLLD
jgi:Myb-like DNA-binding protein FlbD